jgi:hypothetical protein
MKQQHIGSLCLGLLFFSAYLSIILVCVFEWYLPAIERYVMDECTFEYCLDNVIDSRGSTIALWYHLEKLDKKLEISVDGSLACAEYRQDRYQKLYCCYLVSEMDALKSAQSSTDVSYFSLDCPPSPPGTGLPAVFLMLFGIFAPYFPIITCVCYYDFKKQRQIAESLRNHNLTIVQLDETHSL